MTLQKYSTSILPSPDYKIESNFKTLISDFDKGNEYRNRQWRFAKRNFDLPYRALTQAQRDTLHEFYRKRYGAYEPFWFIDFKARSWDDEYVAYAGPLDLVCQLHCGGGTGTFYDQTEYARNSSAIDDVVVAPTSITSTAEASYWGSNAVFDRLVIVITTSGSNKCIGEWQFYSSTGGWTAATVTTDQTNGFSNVSGTYNVDFTISSNWTDYTVNNINAYWMRYQITGASSVSEACIASRAYTYSKTFDIPAILTSTTNLVVYQDSVSTAGYTVASGAGAAGSHRLEFSSYPGDGDLITADFTGNLRPRVRFGSETFSEPMPNNSLYNVVIDLKEVNESEKTTIFAV